MPENSVRHTPGPWRVNVISFTPVVYVTTEDHQTVAVAHAPEHELDAPEHKAQAEANARLIAAAPELYQALVTIRDGYWSEGESWEDMVFDLKRTAAEALRKVDQP